MATADTAPVHPPVLPAQPRPAAPAAGDSAPDPPSGTLIGSVQRAMRLLECVARHQYGAPAKQLARETGLALPTAYHLLRTLVHEGYLCRDKGLFFLGEAAERLSSSGTQQKRRSALAEALAGLSETIGAPVYYAVYRDGEVDIVCVADTPATPAVEEWADFRETAHAHAIGQCLLAQLDDEARRDHLHRHPVRPLTRYTVRDDQTLLKRLERVGRTEPVTEYQEYALGTVCGAVPLTVGGTAATVAISLPVRQADRLLPALRQLQGEVGPLLESLALSISM